MAEEKTQYRGGADRLRDLPEVFTRNNAVRLTGLSEESLKVSLSRWKERGWIESAGPRTETYFNLLVNPNARDEYRVAAILNIYPAAIAVGATVLHAHGWSTQIPHAIQIAIPSRPSLVQLTGVEISTRSRTWFERYHPGVMSEKKSPTFGLRSLKPEYALADLLERETSAPEKERARTWVPDPDDLHLPDDAPAKILAAFEHLGFEAPARYRSVLGGGAGPRG